MSALGQVPGFTYPELAYGESEQLVEVQPTVTFLAGGTVQQTLLLAGSGEAIYVSEIKIVYIATAAAGGRVALVATVDQDGNFLSIYTNPLAVQASQTITLEWSTRLSNAYTLTSAGYSPLHDIILVPGRSLLIQVGGAFAGDRLFTPVLTGLKIPTRGQAVPPPQPIITPVLL